MRYMNGMDQPEMVQMQVVRKIYIDKSWLMLASFLIWLMKKIDISTDRLPGLQIAKIAKWYSPIHRLSPSL